MNRGFATGVAPKFDPNEVIDGKEVEKQNRMSAVTSRLGVTLRSDASFRLLFERIETDFSQLPPIQRAQQPPHPDFNCMTKIHLDENDVLANGKWAVDIVHHLNEAVTGRTRRYLTLTEPEDNAKDLIQPLGRYDVCRPFKKDLVTDLRVEWLQAGKDDLLTHYREDWEWLEQESAKRTDELRLLFLSEPVVQVISSAAKATRVLRYIEGLRGLLASRFLSDGKAVDQLTRDLLRRTNESGSNLTRLRRACGLGLSLSLEHLTEVFLSPDGSVTLSKFLECSDAAIADTVLDDLARLIFLIGRRCHLAQTLGNLSDIMTLLLESLSTQGDRRKLAARISFFVDALITALQHHSHFVHVAGSDPKCECRAQSGVQKLCYDTHMLVFEFANGIRLRPNQVQLVDTICTSIARDKPLCIQLMMGQGKTTVSNNRRAGENSTLFESLHYIDVCLSSFLSD